MKIQKVSEKLFLQTQRGPNPEGSQSGGVPIRRGPNFSNPEGSQFGQPRGVLYLANPEGFYFCQSGEVPILPIRRGPVFANPEGSYFANPEWSQFCQSGGVLILPIRRDPNFANPEGSQLRDRLGTSDCTGNLPFIKDQTKTKQVKLRHSRH